jgi:hypothetical protein
MRLRFPFLNKLQRAAADEAMLSAARAELAMADTALEAARGAYLLVQDGPQPEALRRQQAELDGALHRYHAARHALRLLEQQGIAAASWANAIGRRSGPGAPLTKG